MLVEQCAYLLIIGKLWLPLNVAIVVKGEGAGSGCSMISPTAWPVIQKALQELAFTLVRR